MGSISTKAHVDAVGLHWQLSGQPCLKCTLRSQGKPIGGMVSQPAINFKTSFSFRSGASLIPIRVK